jgi:hypothetical protein
MRQTPFALLLLALSACTLGRANGRQAAELDVGTGRNRPYVWRGADENSTIDAVNTAIAVGWVAGIVALTPDARSDTMCWSDPGEPPHTCPEKAGEQSGPGQPR